MDIFKTLSTSLEERLDVNYYKPVFLRNAVKLSAHSTAPLSQTYLSFDIGHTASVEPHYSFNGEGIPLIAGKVIKNNSLIIHEAEKIKPKSHFEAMIKSHLKPGYLLVVRKGDVGNACVVPANSGELNCSSEVMFFVGKSDADSYFLSSFFNSSHGQLCAKRIQRGSLIPGLSLYDIPSFRVIWPSPTIRKYIGDKVRQAEWLRAHTQAAVSYTNKVLDNAIPRANLTPQLTSIVDIQILNDRLDTQPYRSHYLTLLSGITGISHSKLGDIATISSGNPVPSTEFKSDGIPLVRIRDIGFSGFINQETFVSREYVLAKRTGSAKAGLIVVGMDGEFRAQFFIEEELPQFINQRIAIVNASDIRPELLSVWLNRIEGQYQLNQWSVKTTVEHISLTDIARILIPRLDRSIEDHLADIILTARKSIWYAHVLIATAKLLVEALIEGKLTEDELKTAQEALTSGNREPDRAILARLTRKGIDAADEPPLFPDLDAIYEALDGTGEVASGTRA